MIITLERRRGVSQETKKC